MKTGKYLFLISAMMLTLAACSQGNSTTATYTTVSQASIKAGESVPAPTGAVVLTVEGNISQHNSGDTLTFDIPTLEKLGLIQYDVDDPFAKKNIVYTGVLFSDVLKVAGASPDATMLTLHALDDYSVDMKLADATKWPVMIAIKADGEYMTVDKNGPLISVFPFNDFPELDHLTYDNLWVWSLAKITVK